MEPERAIVTQENVQAPPSTAPSMRREAWIIAILVLVTFFIPQMLWMRTNYWVLTDGQRGLATVTALRTHGEVSYRYAVNGKGHTGRDRLEFGNVGDKTFVYFSASHPGLSRLSKPMLIVESPAGLLIMSFVEFLLVMTIINPMGKWALRDRTAEQKAAKSGACPQP